MNCTRCGAPLAVDSRFCPTCGNPVVSQPTGFAMAGSLDGSGPAYSPTAAPTMTPPVAPTMAPTMAPPVAPPMAPPAAPAATPTGTRRISAKREMKLLLRQGWLVMLGEKRNLIISLLFPLLAAIVSVWIAGENMFENYESTKSACFILVCSAIWCGLFNSIQSIVKERENIKRDYVSGALRIGCYTASRAILQCALCFVQSFVLCLAIPCVELVYGNSLPSSGVLEGPVMLEYFLSIFLIMYASDAMGLMISAIVKKDELASKLAPYILIAQLLFSGVLFPMEGGAELLSGLMVSRWGMEALGSVSDLNDLPLRIHEEAPMTIELVKHKAEDAFDHDPAHLLLVWFILLLFVAVPLVVCAMSLKNVKKDTRG